MANRVEQVVEMWNAGVDKDEIAEQLGIKIKTVICYLSKARKEGQKVGKITTKRNKVVEMWNAGVDKDEIAEQLGIKVNTIICYLSKARKEGKKVRQTTKRNKVVEMWNAGVDKDEIVEQLGIKIKTVCTYLSTARQEGQKVRKIARKRQSTKVDKVVELWNAGMNRDEISEQLGITINTIICYLSKARKEGKKVRQTTKIEQVVELWNAEIDKNEIAKQLGITMNTLNNYLSKARKEGQNVRKYSKKSDEVRQLEFGKQNLGKTEVAQSINKDISKEESTTVQKSNSNTDTSNAIKTMLCTYLPMDVAKRLRVKPYIVYDTFEKLSQEEKKEILTKFIKSKKEVYLDVKSKKREGLSTYEALKSIQQKDGIKYYKDLSEIYLVLGLQNKAEGVLNSLLGDESRISIHLKDKIMLQLHKIKTEALAQNIRKDYYNKSNMDGTKISYEDLCKKYNVSTSFLIQTLGMERTYVDIEHNSW